MKRMAFEMYKQHKLEDRLEQEAYEWCEYAIESFYDIDSIDDMTKEQVQEVLEYANSEDSEYFAPYVAGCLNSICDNWLVDNEEEI
jgi:hypothetical protein